MIKRTIKGGVSINIFKIVEERSKVPIRNVKNDIDQIEYISKKIESNDNQIHFIVPNNFFLSSAISIKLLKDKLFSKYYLTGIYDLDKLYSPNTGIQFSLFHFSKEKNKEVRFLKLSNKKQLVTNYRDNIKDRGILDISKFSNWYKEHLSQVEQFSNNSNIELSDRLIIFYEKNEDIQKDKLYLDYYLPEYRENRRKLDQEEIVLLKDIADVITPRRKQKCDRSRQLLVKDFEYPLKYEELPTINSIETRLMKEDIILSTHGKYRAYLFEEDYSDIAPTANSVIIRLKSNTEFSIYYLYNYLTKKIAQNYFSSMTLGSIINYIKKSDVLNLPIIKPKKRVLEISEKEFQLTSNHEYFKISEYNQVINRKWIMDTPIQTEIMANLLTSIMNTRYKKLKKIIESDLVEIAKCINVGAFKSSIIMCGSVLEGILIDWISDTEKHDKYIEKKDSEIKLYRIIEELRNTTVKKEIVNLAHIIRKRRNAVHPKRVYEDGIEFSKDMAFDTLKSLEKIVESRFQV
ncbi:DUF4145 domain-containing protein [Vallitalea okinawensis]|uniref:DUF4145 domain-containing protein n=1 Tax=Vallitalea okinawensis TaxID=2078660 RepID=UPI000CFBA2E8|nr:DUF4145 domain-containing protein [Vallitalea okinawensis]